MSLTQRPHPVQGQNTRLRTNRATGPLASSLPRKELTVLDCLMCSGLTELTVVDRLISPRA